jgi:chromosome segregation ATPase
MHAAAQQGALETERCFKEQASELNTWRGNAQELTAERGVLTAERDVLRQTLAFIHGHISALTDLNKEMKSLVDAQQQEIQVVHKTAISQQESVEREKSIQDKSIQELTFELDTSRENAMELTAELDVLRRRMDVIGEHNAALVKSMGEAKARFDAQQQEIEVVLVMSQRDKEEKEKRIKELDAYRQNNALVEEHNKEMKRVVDAQQQEIKVVLATSQRDNMQKEKRITELTCELDTSRDKATELTAGLDVLHQRMALMEEQQRALVTRLENQNTCLGESRQDNISKENCLKALKHLNQEIKSLVDSQQQEIEIVLATAQQVNMEKEEHLTALREVTVELETSRGNAKELTAKLEALQDIHEQLQKEFAAEFDVLRSQTEGVRAELKVAKDSTVELDDLRRRMDVIGEHNNNALVKSLAEAETRLEESQHKNHRKESCISALTDLNKEMKSLVDAQQQEIQDVLAAAQQDNMEKGKRITELTCELDTSRVKATELTAGLDVLRQRMALMEEQHNIALIKSLGEAESRLADSKIDNAQKEKCITELTLELDSSRGDAKELTAELDDLRQKLHAMEERKNAMTKSLAEAGARLEASKHVNLRKESCISELTDLNKEIKSLVDAQQQEIQDVLAAAQQDNMEKEKRIKELTCERDTSMLVADATLAQASTQFAALSLTCNHDKQNLEQALDRLNQTLSRHETEKARRISLAHALLSSKRRTYLAAAWHFFTTGVCLARQTRSARQAGEHRSYTSSLRPHTLGASGLIH